MKDRSEVCYGSPMESAVCVSCHASKASLKCGFCKGNVCKRCAQYIEKESFSFLEKVPDELSHTLYCCACFSEKIAPQLAIYTQTMARAKGVFVFQKKQGEQTRHMKRSEKPLRVLDCSDRDETLLRLAFFAAQLGFNALVDVDITSQKVRHFGYQNSKWQGVGIPTHIDAEKLERESKPGKILLPRPQER